MTGVLTRSISAMGDLLLVIHQAKMSLVDEELGRQAKCARCVKVKPAPVITAILFVALVATVVVGTVGWKVISPDTIGGMVLKHSTRITPNIESRYIWGVVYLLLAGHAFKFTGKRRLDVDLLFPAATLLNGALAFEWVESSQVQSCIIAAVLWIVLAGLWLRINVLHPPMPTPLNICTLIAPISLYFGTVTVLLVELVAVVVEQYVPFGLTSATIAFFIVAALGAVALAITCDVVYVFGIVWGLAAISVSADARRDDDIRNVAALAVIAILGATVERVATFSLQTCRRTPSEVEDGDSLVNKNPSDPNANLNFLVIDNLH